MDDSRKGISHTGLEGASKWIDLVGHFKSVQSRHEMNRRQGILFIILDLSSYIFHDSTNSGKTKLVLFRYR